MSSLSDRSDSRVEADVCRVMVVDDSAVIRGYFRRALESDPEIKIVSSAGNGAVAVETLAREPVDVIVLDIEMPVMDGLTALPKLLEVYPSVRIVMASTLTVANADVSLKALSIGAADYVAKPTTSAALHSAEDFKRELIEKVKALGAAKKSGAAVVKQPATMAAGTKPPAVATAFETRSPASLPATVVGIGSSTGGPQALMTVLGGLPSNFDLPILISHDTCEPGNWFIYSAPKSERLEVTCRRNYQRLTGHQKKSLL